MTTTTRPTVREALAELRAELTDAPPAGRSRADLAHARGVHVLCRPGRCLAVRAAPELAPADGPSRGRGRS